MVAGVLNEIFYSGANPKEKISMIFQIGLVTGKPIIIFVSQLSCKENSVFNMCIQENEYNYLNVKWSGICGHLG